MNKKTIQICRKDYGITYKSLALEELAMYIWDGYMETQILTLDCLL